MRQLRKMLPDQTGGRQDWRAVLYQCRLQFDQPQNLPLYTLQRPDTLGPNLSRLKTTRFSTVYLVTFNLRLSAA